MSHYTEIATELTDADYLAAALADMGLAEIEIHDTPQALYGWEGDERQQRAHVIVRRECLGGGRNDIGFVRGADGKFQALISEFDSTDYDAAWLGKVAQRYGCRMAKDVMARQDFSLVQERVEADGRIRLSLRRMA